MLFRRYKIRLLPTEEQANKMWEHVHACRFIWNYMLERQNELQKQGKKWVSYIDMAHELTNVKARPQYNWLKSVSNASLQAECRLLEEAYRAFFKGSRGHPRYKSRKKSSFSFSARTKTFRALQGEVVHIEKVGKVGYQTDLPISQYGKFYDVQIMYVHGKWLACFSVKREKQARILSEACMGIDLGVKELATVACGNQCWVYPNINKSPQVKRQVSRLKHLQRKAARKYVKNHTKDKSKNIERIERQIGKAFFRLANFRRDYRHKVTHELVEFLPSRIVMESLDVASMLKNRMLAEKIQAQGFYEFISMMRYKSEERGIEFVQADRYFPSSKRCCCCGKVKRDLTLKDRIYQCSGCGLVIDRDHNAAINLMNYSHT